MKTGHQKRRESRQAKSVANAGVGRLEHRPAETRAPLRHHVPSLPWDVWMGLVMTDRSEPRGYRQFDGSI